MSKKEQKLKEIAQEFYEETMMVGGMCGFIFGIIYGFLLASSI